MIITKVRCLLFYECFTLTFYKGSRVSVLNSGLSPKLSDLGPAENVELHLSLTIPYSQLIDEVPTKR